MWCDSISMCCFHVIALPGRIDVWNYDIILWRGLPVWGPMYGVSAGGVWCFSGQVDLLQGLNSGYARHSS